MSFSSLTPRNHRNGVARTRSGKRRPRQPAQHLRLWEAIRLTREELSHWQARAERVDALFKQHILPRETRFTSVYSDLTHRLMDRYEADKLNSSRQALLALWITDNLRALSAHPFLDIEQRESLVQRWQQLQLAESGLAASDLSTTSKPVYSDDEDELDDDDVVFDFGWHSTPSSGSRRKPGASASSAPEQNETISLSEDEEALSDDRSSRQEDPEEEPLDVDAKVSELEKRLSIDRLFRQLARVLHPDLEQDEIRKAQKHELMSQCLEARKNKDIDSLLTLYCEHIGDLPDEFSADDHEELIKALQLQLRQLQFELRQERFGDPLRVQIVERYSHGDESTQTLHRVMRHAESLDAETQLLETQLSELKTDSSFNSALDLRREIELDRMVIDQMTGYT